MYNPILTNIGKAKIADAIANNTTVNINTLAVGDSNGTRYSPTESQINLVNERYRTTIGSISIKPESPSLIEMIGVVPSNIGGFTIREVAVFDSDGDMIAISDHPDFEKFIISGSANSLELKFMIAVTNTDVVTLIVDDSAIYATREYVNNLDNGNVKTTGNQTIAGVKTFSSSPIVPTPTTGTQVANKAYVDNVAVASNDYVALAGDQTIAGVKTFSSSPIVPTPTTGTQAVNKDYVDSNANASSLPIGAILNGYTIFNNCIVAFGGEFNRADYPKLWAYLQANTTLLKTQAQWQTESTANGGICGFFSSGNGTTTFRVPNLDKAFLRPESRAIASYQADEFKSHSHTAERNPANRAGTSAAGSRVEGTELYQTGTTGGIETRPKNIAVLPLIVAK